jgi:putative ABC transport system permease protein
LQPASKRLWIGVLLCLVLAGVLLLVGPQVPGHEARAGTFFGSGALFLTAGLMALFAWMKRTRSTSFVPTTTLVGYRVWWTIAQLGVRNAARHPSRSLLTVGLLAFAAFLLVAVESFRRRATEGDGSITAPDGGFALIGESDIPIIRDLNSAPGRRELLDRLRQRYTERGLPTEEVKRKVDADEQLLQQTKIVALRARAGDDASCQNLYQAGQPRLLGVPRSLIERGGFVFESSRVKTPEQKANPWLVLLDDSQGIPAVGEANTLLYQLKIALGADYPLLDDQGVEHRLRIAGAIKDSVFQSALLVSEENFLRLFPGHEGYHFFLIAPPAGQALAVRDLLQAALEDHGFAVTLSVDRLAAYQAIESTYLTTFQALGGLGLLLGSLGLAVVLLRSVWERQSELALLQALGYPKITIGWLVLAENGFLLFVGLVVGTSSALLSILPQLLSGQGSVPVVNLLLLFAVVLLTGLAAGTLAVVWTLRSDIVPALRRE